MPCFTSEIQNNQIIFACNVTKPLSATNAPPELPGLPVFQALLDTGAQSTCIRKNVVDSVGLTESGWGSMHGVGGEVKCPKYMVDIYISIVEGPAILNPDGNVEQHMIGKGFRKIHASFLEGEHFDFDVLLGMDIITQCNFTIHTGQLFTLCI